MHMQYQAQYWTRIGADNRPVTPTQGIKQGCNIAPYLYTIMLIDRISENTSTQWTNDGLTWYADDAFAVWMIQSIDELRQALRDLGTIITVLNTHGMDIQADKCAVLLNLHGKDVHKVSVYQGKTRREDISQGDSINAAKMDRGFTVFMAQTGPAGLLTNLYQASIAWNKVRETEPKKITPPLRITLLTLMDG
eukprot:s4090_g10.t1